MHGFDFQTAGLLLFLAAIVAMTARRLAVPYSVGLVVAGIALALVAPGVAPPFNSELVYFVCLPPLVFEAAIQIPWRPFRRELPLLLALVTVGVVLATGVVAVGMHYVTGWSWIGALVFGVLIAATDPVSVIALFRQVAVPHRLHLLVEAESLLNDGVAAVGFAILVGVAGGGAVGVGAVGLHLLGTVAGGIAAGAAVAVPLILIAGRTDDWLVEITLTMLIAFGSFLLAEEFRASGVLATLTAGMIVGNWGFCGSISEGGKRGVLHQWEFAAFLINALIFMLIGGGEATTPILAVLSAAGAATLFSLLGRAAAIYPVVALFRRTGLSVPRGYQHVLFWGGLRGALALALATALPTSIPERDAIIAVAFAVVAFSIFVQGLTMPWLIRRLKLTQEPPAAA